MALLPSREGGGQCGEGWRRGVREDVDTRTNSLNRPVSVNNEDDVDANSSRRSSPR